MSLLPSEKQPVSAMPQVWLRTVRWYPKTWWGVAWKARLCHVPAVCCSSQSPAPGRADAAGAGSELCSPCPAGQPVPGGSVTLPASVGSRRNPQPGLALSPPAGHRALGRSGVLGVHARTNICLRSVPGKVPWLWWYFHLEERKLEKY